MKHLPKIIFRIVPHHKNRNNQCDDYYTTKKGEWNFTVSSMKDWRYEFCVFIHALCEWFLCMVAGVKEKDITNFDKKFEAERAEGKWKDEEPGDDPRAPYQKQHQIATSIEYQLVAYLGIDIQDYDNYINQL